MSASITRLTAAFVVTLGLLLGAGVLASSSGAAPYTTQPTISVSTQTPAIGSTIAVSGNGFAPNELVTVTLGGHVLGTARADASGSFSLNISLPTGVSGNQSILATGLTSGKTTSIQLNVQSEAGAGGGTGNVGGGGGGLPATGAAVIGVGVLGGLLLIGGGVMLLLGKRRKVNA